MQTEWEKGGRRKRAQGGEVGRQGREREKCFGRRMMDEDEEVMAKRKEQTYVVKETFWGASGAVKHRWAGRGARTSARTSARGRSV